jgi:hypothetical protein
MLNVFTIYERTGWSRLQRVVAILRSRRGRSRMSASQGWRRAEGQGPMPKARGRELGAFDQPGGRRPKQKLRICHLASCAASKWQQTGDVNPCNYQLLSTINIKNKMKTDPEAGGRGQRGDMGRIGVGWQPADQARSSLIKPLKAMMSTISTGKNCRMSELVRPNPTIEKYWGHRIQKSPACATLWRGKPAFVALPSSHGFRFHCITARQSKAQGPRWGREGVRCVRWAGTRPPSGTRAWKSAQVFGFCPDNGFDSVQSGN